ncbi:MAG TPA: hypothetical protein VIS06_10520 [Mycobacteriales bacterium]|jgi:hypothetical protein
MTHPDLPGSLCEVAESAYRRVWAPRGWQATDPPTDPESDPPVDPDTDTSTTDPVTQPDQSTSEPAPARKRSKES